MTAFVAGRVGVVGKLPSRAEYLPVPTHAPSFAELDAWLTVATEWAAGATGAAWPAAFAAGAMQGFVFHAARDASDTVLCGALAPSRDSAGRLFPLAVGVPVRMASELLARPELLPFSLEALWAGATSALADLMSGAEALTEPMLDAGADAEVGEAEALYDDWAAGLPLQELWTLLGPALCSPAATLRLLFETLAPARGVEPFIGTLSLRLPLGLGGGAAVCFWLDLVRRYAGWRKTLPSLFWSHDGQNGAALLHLGSPSKAALAELWLPSGTRDDIADLTLPVAPSAVEAFAPLPAAAAALLDDPQGTLGQLLAAL